jgi:predicted AlkP superfamily pyrophosphatase or phosphodiesterase
MLIILLLIDGLGYEYIKPKSFWGRHSKMIRNSEPTITAPNWATILSGLKPERHDVLDNSLHGLPNYRFPYSTIFDDVKSSLMISDWKMMEKFSSECDFIHNRVWYSILKNVGRYGKKYDLIVVNYARLDTVAHEKHWGSEAYEKTLRYVDGQTEKLYEKLLNLDIPFVLMGSSDHGGYEDDHEEGHLNVVHRVPFLWLTNQKDLRVPKIKNTYEIRSVIKKLQK